MSAVFISTTQTNSLLPFPARKNPSFAYRDYSHLINIIPYSVLGNNKLSPAAQHISRLRAAAVASSIACCDLIRVMRDVQQDKISPSHPLHVYGLSEATQPCSKLVTLCFQGQVCFTLPSCREHLIENRSLNLLSQYYLST